MVTGPGRWLSIGLLTALPIGGAVIACTGGEDVAYSSSGLTSDAAADGPRNLTEAGFLPTKEGPAKPSPQPTGKPFACGTAGLDLDGGPCDPAAGYGCCLVASGGGVAANNQCDEQRAYSLAALCQATNDTFIACLGTDGENLCCWQPQGNGRFHARYRSACDSDGFEACDPAAKDGCLTGGPCEAVSCRGVQVGYCKPAGAPTRNPCPQ